MRGAVTHLLQTLLLVAVIVAAAALAIDHWRPVRVAGGSMRPALAPGDLVIVAVGKRAAVGQIALLDSRRHGAFLHRVIGVNRDRTLRTKGDANPVVDFDGLPATAVVGPVVLVAPVGQAIERYRHRACATMTAQ